ncbi:GCN5 family acetyltransferase [Devosia epidermidihirudinis]|uniref:GCN5 family acetyltransferase n=1 Tax=Devosia epidermidihirudinis TaxID=1293439 RepID=A0A0F5QKM6_9HYPH|nr:GNAT family protein [Devosia epidermidihirudinis]KKC41248.1 GCN5 family acetyltransferase [Devosia epidermidihirudinis]KKC41276.1 GCN5 family acetyltransferase [Devosia epidermidihirudinis]
MLWPWSSPASLISLRGHRLLLRLPQMGDYDAWYALRRGSRDFLRPFEPRWTEADLARQVFINRVKRARQEVEEGTDYSFFIFSGEGRAEDIVGGITLSNVRRRAAQFVNLGYWMGQQYAGQGIMSEAVSVCLPFVFDTLDLHRIHAAFLPGNVPSRRVLEKNGFVEEGFAEKYLQINGRWEDHVLFGMTRERYELHRAANRR